MPRKTERKTDPNRLAALNAFVLVARQGSFTKAADSLGVSPSALSQTLRAFEASIGVRLVNRTTRSVAPTEAGALLLARAVPALAELDQALTGIRETAGKPAGTLRINLPRIVLQHVVSPHLAGFHARYPEVRIDLTVDDGMADLVGGHYDAGIRLGERLQQDMIAVPLGPSLRLVTVGSPAYFKRHPAPKTIEDLRTHACLRSRFVSRGTLYRWEYTVNGRDIEIEVDGPMITNDLDALVDAARQGLGLAHVLDVSVLNDLRTGTLKAVLERHCPSFPGFHLYTTSRRQMPPKLRVFIDYLKTALQPAAST